MGLSQFMHLVSIYMYYIKLIYSHIILYLSHIVLCMETENRWRQDAPLSYFLANLFVAWISDA